MYLTFSPAKLSALRTRIAYLPPEADHVAVLVAAAKGTHATEAEALAYAAAEGPAVVLSVARHRNAAEDARVACPCVPWAMTDLTARTCTNERPHRLLAPRRHAPARSAGVLRPYARSSATSRRTATTAETSGSSSTSGACRSHLIERFEAAYQVAHAYVDARDMRPPTPAELAELATGATTPEGAARLLAAAIRHTHTFIRSA